jgi:hypothetical protein
MEPLAVRPQVERYFAIRQTRSRVHLEDCVALGRFITIYAWKPVQPPLRGVTDA